MDIYFIHIAVTESDDTVVISCLCSIAGIPGKRDSASAFVLPGLYLRSEL